MWQIVIVLTGILNGQLTGDVLTGHTYKKFPTEQACNEHKDSQQFQDNVKKEIDNLKQERNEDFDSSITCEEVPGQPDGAGRPQGDDEDDL